MRIVCLVSSLVLACGCTDASEKAPAPAEHYSVAGRTADASTLLEIHAGSERRYQLTVARDSTVAHGAEPHVDLIGVVPGVAVVLVDRYPSAPAGLSLCQAGEERFLRVVTIAGGKAAETYTAKVASCHDNLELAEPGIEWVPQRATLRINWLAGPGGEPEMRSLQIGADGKTQPLP